MSEQSSASPSNIPDNSQSGNIVITPPLFKLKLLDALKNNNLEQLKTTIQSIETTSNHSDLAHIKDSILNLAVQVSSVKFIETLLSYDISRSLNIDINYQDSNGNTPLHIVALNNRIDVAQLLLRSEGVNDTILNDDNKQPIELTNDLNMVALMQNERARYIKSIAGEFKIAFAQHDFAKLDEILVQPRNFELLDINGYDPETGDTVLHEFVKKKDIGMVKWILAHGGDPFKRDRNGKLPIELIAKTDQTMAQLLKDASQGQSVIEINTKVNAGMQAPTFKGYLRKWTNYASGYKLRWFILDSDGILSYYRCQEDASNACRGSLNMKSAVLHLDSSEKLKFEIISKSGDRWHLKGNHPVETSKWVWSLQGSIRFAKDRAKAQLVAQQEAESRKASLETTNTHRRNESGISSISELSASSDVNKQSPLRKLENSEYEKHPENAQVSDDEDDYDDDESEDDSFQDDNFDHSSLQEISVLKNRFGLELSYLKDLILSIKDQGASTDPVNISLNSIDSLITDFNLYNEKIKKRDEKLTRALKKQRDINELWINSIKELENELILKSSELETFETERRKIKKALARRSTLTTSAPDVTEVIDKPEDIDPLQKEPFQESPIIPEEPTPDEEISRILENEGSEDEFFDADEFEEDSEDEGNVSDVLTLKSVNTFKKSIDGNALAEESEELPEFSTSLQKEKGKQLILEGSFKGYEDPVRTDLGLKIDDRPKISLWGILKSMIGKDITKLALPVSFNEPTSLLQRCAEDLEYSYLLDQAASFEDSTLRLLYIAAFAVSEYSSTINRVAKPFNPLLGETFEYSRPDQGYRYLTEQVSHHPPISAVIAESAKWDYYGETPVNSGFNGRSFDVTPTATWHLQMRPDSVDSQESYTWKKVTTSVIGIMLGNPSIDNYGEMVITNHNTGDKATITMKPRGWSSKSAYEVTGYVTDKDGNKQWALGGHWDSKIYGKKIIKNEVHIDYSTKKIETGPNEQGVKFLMWQTTPRPTVPFNLTSFAISLNALQPKLKEWLAPTDTRLRPDQRAMEEGRYDDASELKLSVENKQRAARKERDETGQEYQPSFFTRVQHPLTGEEHWQYNGSYWKARNEKALPKIDIFV